MNILISLLEQGDRLDEAFHGTLKALARLGGDLKVFDTMVLGPLHALLIGHLTMLRAFVKMVAEQNCREIALLSNLKIVREYR